MEAQFNALEVVLVTSQYIDERIERMESETTSLAENSSCPAVHSDESIDQLSIRTARLAAEKKVLKTRNQVLESKVEQLQADVANLKTDITLMKADVHGLKKIFYGEATDSDVDDPKGGDDPNGSDDPMGGDDPRGKTNDPKGKNGPKGGKDLKGGKYSDLEEVDEGDEKGGKVTEVSYSKLEARFLSDASTLLSWPSVFFPQAFGDIRRAGDMESADESTAAREENLSADGDEQVARGATGVRGAAPMRTRHPVLHLHGADGPSGSWAPRRVPPRR